MNEFNYEGWIGSILDNSTSTTEFPIEGSENVLYVVRDNGEAKAYVWDDGISDYTELAGGGGGGSTQSNWNENSASSAAYVKNRTHWEETENGNTIVHQLDSKYIPTASSVASSAAGYVTGGQVYDYVASQVGDIETILASI